MQLAPLDCVEILRCVQMNVTGRVITTTQAETTGTAYCNTNNVFGASAGRVCSKVTLSDDGKTIRLQSDIDPFYAASFTTRAGALAATVRAFPACIWHMLKSPCCCQKYAPSSIIVVRVLIVVPRVALFVPPRRTRGLRIEFAPTKPSPACSLRTSRNWTAASSSPLTSE
jgi:hypothetical protein